MQRVLETSLLILVLLAGCGPTVEAPGESHPPDFALLREARELAYQRTQREFERAEFFSPDPESSPGELRWMSPLIVEELDPLQAEDSPLGGFGRISTDPSGRAVVHPEEPAVYYWAERVEISAASFEQSTFVWFYCPFDSGGEISWRGFRMVLDDRGFAMVWEILSSEAELRVLYVSEPLEAAARRQHGATLPGRRYAVEPSVEQHPDLVVARVVGDGPQPMGPFLYLDYPARRVSTLICRCEPSQVGWFPASHLYRLIDRQQVDPAVRAILDRVEHDGSGSYVEALRNGIPEEVGGTSAR
jgi:hypothetical protein